MNNIIHSAAGLKITEGLSELTEIPALKQMKKNKEDYVELALSVFEMIKVVKDERLGYETSIAILVKNSKIQYSIQYKGTRMLLYFENGRMAHAVLRGVENLPYGKPYGCTLFQSCLKCCGIGTSSLQEFPELTALSAAISRTVVHVVSHITPFKVYESDTGGFVIS
ncbi:hypothetical protein BDQ17DRAFT_1333184 [Cyathus striatus]|nr:hypothetical protein BDQ17DRAFT_1333184 [Cyathus striatus]